MNEGEASDTPLVARIKPPPEAEVLSLWEWEDGSAGSDIWVAFDSDTSAQLASAHGAGTATLKMEHGTITNTDGNTWIVDLPARTMTRITNGFERAIRGRAVAKKSQISAGKSIGRFGRRLSIAIMGDHDKDGEAAEAAEVAETAAQAQADAVVKAEEQRMDRKAKVRMAEELRLKRQREQLLAQAQAEEAHLLRLREETVFEAQTWACS